MKIPFDSFSTNNLLNGFLALQILKNYYGAELDSSAELYEKGEVNSFVETYRDMNRKYEFFIDIYGNWNWRITNMPSKRFCETMEEFLELLKEPLKITVRDVYKNQYGSLISILPGPDGKFLLGGKGGDPLQLLEPTPALKTMEELLEIHKINKWVLVGKLLTPIEPLR